jgi:hypothetical protein
MLPDNKMEKSRRKLRKRSERLFLKNLAMPLLPFLLLWEMCGQNIKGFLQLMICSHNLSCAENLIKIRNNFTMIRQILFFKVSFFKIKKYLTFYFLSDIIIKITNFCRKRELREKH